MTKVRVLSTSVVQARNDKENPERIELTPYDFMQLRGGPIQFGLVFRKPNSLGTFVEHLKDSLSCTLDFFYPLAGRLAVVEHDDGAEKTVSFSIDCNNQGAQFVHAVCDHVTIADILEPVLLPSILDPLFPLNGVKNYQSVLKPLLGIQITDLVDGVFISCVMNHSVADGTSFWHFLNSWSEISRRGSDHVISKSPVFDRSFFSSSFSFPVRMFSSLNEINEFTLPPSPILEKRVFHFSKTKIAELKARSNLDNRDVIISSLQSILSHVWRSMLRIQGVNPNEDTSFLLSLELRPRLQPPLPKEYFGNPIDFEIVTLKVKDIIHEDGLGRAALQLNRAVASVTSEKLRRKLEGWLQNPRLIRPSECPANAFSAANSPRFDVYGNDFGWGIPVAVRSRSVSGFDRMMTVFRGVEEGSMDIEVCSSAESLEILGNDSEFN